MLQHGSAGARAANRALVERGALMTTHHDGGAKSIAVDDPDPPHSAESRSHP